MAVPLPPVPSARQFAWHQLDFYGFVHFTVNTFTDKEWGYGDESPQIFNPTALDTRQWARTARDAGMKGLILTCKHHDGFCLWPSKYTEHSVKNSPWKKGKGDLVREFSEACREFGLKFGVYLSPWDRNHAEYGRPAYIEYYRNQMRELLTNYGPVFEVWLDGANGGDGYYGGARERRQIDNSTYYDWDNTLKIVRELQPEACVFSDGGPDIRWVGNESGEGSTTNWNTFNAAGRFPGYNGGPGYNHRLDLGQGHEGGSHWLPAEVDVSIRPGWFYHTREDRRVRSAANLLDLYLMSAGRGCNLLLNLPPDRRGLIHETDVENLLAFGQIRKALFNNPVARFCGEEATGAMPLAAEGSEYVAQLPLASISSCNLVQLREPIALGQRIAAWVLEGQTDGTWQELATGTTIGNQRLLRFKTRTLAALRLRVTRTRGEPQLSGFTVFSTPEIAREPRVRRDRCGLVTIDTGTETATIRYTLDGSAPSVQSPVYVAPLPLPRGGTVRAAVLPADNPGMLAAGSACVEQPFGLNKDKWRVLACSSENPKMPASAVIDGDPQTYWETAQPNLNPPTPHFVALDLGEEVSARAFGYLPRQEGHWGMVTRGAFAVSSDGKEWRTVVAEAVFDNIGANPILQVVELSEPVKARYLRFTSLTAIDNHPAAAVAELEVFPV